MKKILIIVLIALAVIYLATKKDDSLDVKDQEIKIDRESIEQKDEEKEDDHDHEDDLDEDHDHNEDVETQKDVIEETVSSDYKNGIYSSRVSYPLPNGGSHYVDLKLTVENDIVTDMTLTFDGENGSASSKSQTRFAEAIDPFVLGKDLDSVAPLSRIGGASWTTDAYNDAVSEIRVSAS